MANKFFSKLFGEEAKLKKAMHELKALKKQYTIYDKKFTDGTISKKELDKYYEVKESIKKMAKKYTMKDGKLVLNEQSAEVAPPSKPEVQQMPEPVQQAPVQQTPVQQAPVQQAPVQQAPVQQAPVQQFEAQQFEKQERLRMEQVRQEQEAQYMQEQARRAQEAQYMQEQERRAQEAQYMQEQARQEQETQSIPVTQPNKVNVVISVQETPEMMLAILESDVEVFDKSITAAIEQGLLFRFGQHNINGNKILSYRFE